MPDDPWGGIEPPKIVNAMSARRVSEDGRWDFFWGRELDGRVLLLLQHGGEPISVRRLPQPHGIQVIETVADSSDRRIVVFRLLETEQRDVFHSLCRDIISSTASALHEEDAVQIALTRTWRWHHLLRGGSNSRLSLEEQKGLIGELAFLEREILSRYPPKDALRSWRGPLGSPKDFEVGPVCIECKARRGGASPYVRISSEHQLDDTGLAALFLHVVSLHPSPDEQNGETVRDVALRLRTLIATDDGLALDSFEGLLSAAGFRWSDDYDDTRWEQGDAELFHCAGAFPRLAAEQIPPGIDRVTYSLSLGDCAPFRVETSALEEALASHGDVHAN